MQEAVAAAEYHSKDFEWEVLRREIESDPSLSYHHSLSSTSFSTSTPCPSSDSRAWSLFHSRHSSGKFFKERRYLLKEFPELLCNPEYLKVLEVGCGNGSTVLPILRANQKIDVYACDCSVEALERAKVNIQDANIVGVRDRFHSFCCDISATCFPKWLACDSCRHTSSKRSLNCDPVVKEDDETQMTLSSMKDNSCCLGGVDFITLVFTLSAVPPEKMSKAIMECFSVLKPGGLLLFRDYGLYDMTLLRFELDKRVGFRHYMRGDGTYSYYFDLEGVRDLFVGAGFSKLELEYCCVKSVNRQKGNSMRRVWVHGKFQKPLQSCVLNC